MTYIGFPLIALVFMSIFLCLYYSKKRIDLFENKIVISMMICNIIGLLLELGCYLVMAFLKIENTFIGMFILKSYIAYIPILNWLLTGYIFALTNGNYGNKDYNMKPYFIKIMLVFLPIVLVVVGITYIAPLQYVSEAPKFYTYGVCTNAILYSFGLLFPIWIGRCVYSTFKNKNRKEINARIYLLLVGAVVVASAGGLTQFVDRSILILTTAHSIMLTLIYFTIENPDLKLLRQMELAKMQAEKSNRAKSDFLSSMSHEIRTPLNAIYGLSEDNLRHVDEVPPIVAENARDIMYASETLLEIVGNILDINKIEADKMELVDAPYNFREEITNMCKVTATRIGEKNINFKLNISEDLPYELIGDKGKVKEIINNLLTNAIKYTEKGEINLNIKCINDYNNKRCNVLATCQDTGKGIKPELIGRLFKKFDRLDVELNTTTEGTGLGLAITKSLIDMMGGKINVKSQFGKGSIFFVNIPQKISKVTSPMNNEEEVQSKEKENNNKELKVLIVDDNLLNLKVARRAMDGLGFLIDESLDGKDAIEKINSGKTYDLILMDIMMPNMSGEACLQELKKIEGFKTPVIAVTADASNGARQHYINEGFIDYIAKPFNKEQITEKIEEIFK